ncbi:molybdenum ABC transporter ATP-binding protein [Caenimonas sedimenti]|uniref:Molybdenum ABC transporter ATP-binding protein n=1 Tax=Caenimonas sedimenti TaxID=2596921 RepID=A0A562ZIH9_9BURK|nr:molybdenum ABC transporter ATP-binding protein [Caenimonas sedimenti]TWO68400.1 molybdenum ABC transporter ATP-binding protein [Caenimonas sedimenti]
MNTQLRLRLARGEFTLDVDLALPASGITAVFGPSGCGKTTLLRCVAGLERAPAGRVEVEGELWQDESRGLFVPTWRRPLGYVFQEASLFDHLDVRGNLAFGARRAASREAISAEAVIDLLGIAPLLGRRPHQLSGGERQRVAIARALAAQPRILLLDEPLASLDLARRREILPWLEKLRDELRVPMLYVTHAADEVARLADTLVLLDQGRVVAAGPLAGTLARLDLPPLLGDDTGVLLQGTVRALDARWHLAEVAFEGGALWLADSGLAVGQAARVRVLARDVSIALQPPAGTSIQNLLPCDVRGIATGEGPSQAMVQLACRGGSAGIASESLLLARITARAADQLALAPGMRVWAQVKSAALVR